MITSIRIGASSLAAAAIVVASILLPAQGAIAGTVSVSPPGQGGQFSSIQAGINAAGSGGTVNVAPGTYVENIQVGHYVNIVGSGAGQSIIQAAVGGRAVVSILAVRYAAGARLSLTGFTIRNGTGAPGNGGGITIYSGADPLIANNTIENNRGNAYGGGISISQKSSPIIRDNIIRNNTSESGGAGIFAVDGSNPVISGNTITGNQTAGANIANGGSSGGGIYVEGTSGLATYPVILNNTISNNYAEFAGGGIMVRTNARAIIEGNTIDGNRAAYGAGVHIETEGAPVGLEANTIINNVAASNGRFGGSGYGGGVSVYAKSQVGMTGNDLRGNAASNGGGGLVIAEGGSASLDSNTFLGNRVGPTSGGVPYAAGGAVYLAGASLTAFNNVIAGNDAQQGGGVAVFNNGSAGIASNTFVANTASVQGGGIFVINGGATGNVSNNIFSGNGNYQLFETTAGRVVKRNNLFENGGSTAGAYSGSGAARATGEDVNAAPAAAGNFSGSPAFTNPGANDYSLTRGSRAIDRSATSDVTVVPSDDRRSVVRATGVPDVGAFEFEAAPIVKTTVYRFWSTSKSSHFYTVDKNERNVVASSYSPVEWRYEGRAYEAFGSQLPGTIPLYRFYSQTYNGHFYTADPGERDQVEQNYSDREWLFEGVAYYVYPLATGGNTDIVYRFWSPQNKHHFYTASEAEKNYVSSSFPRNIWTLEGPQFRVPR